jgi:hypothetical protein
MVVHGRRNWMSRKEAEEYILSKLSDGKPKSAKELYQAHGQWRWLSKVKWEMVHSGRVAMGERDGYVTFSLNVR